MNLLRAVILTGALLPQVAAAQAAAPPAPVAGPGDPVAVSPLAPDTVLMPVGGPRIVLLLSPGVGVAALRLTVPLREGAVDAGAGRLLSDLALERMRALARPVGAQVSASRTPWGLAYTVVGAAADFEYLAYLLREAVSAPDVTGPALAEARLRLQGEAAEAVETPAGRVAADLRAQLAAGAPPLEGTPSSVPALDAGRVREAWLRSHQASAMTLVVSAPVVPEVVLAATRGMGAPEDAAAPPPDAPAGAGPRAPAPQTLRDWYGEAWVLGAPGDPRAALVASLVADGLRGRTAGMDAAVELWDLPHGQALAVVAGAWPQRAQAMRRAVSGALSAARDGLDQDALARAVAAARRDLVMAARTPAGMVQLVGRSMEGTGDPFSAARSAESLASVDLASVRGLLDELLRQRPRTAQVRP